MFKINLQVTGFFRMLIGRSKLEYTVNQPEKANIYDVLHQLTQDYGGEMYQLLFLEDGTLDDWSRVILNGRDIRFTPEEEQFLSEGDHLLIMSISAGG